MDGKSLSTVETLIRRVPQIVNLKSWDDETAVMLAVQKGQHKIVKCLLAKEVGCTQDKEELIWEALVFANDARTGSQANTVLEIISSLDMEGSETTLKSVRLVMLSNVHVYPSQVVRG